MTIVSEYNIEKADFEKQKEELKSFAEQPATSTELDKFDTDGQWSDFWGGGLLGVLSGHKVTGEELNSLVTKLQSCFVEINERNRKVIKEFGQVYETFEALDKGYIQGILIGVKSAEKASQEAKSAQKDIDATIKALQITINKLKEFKDEVKGYHHLQDIDEIWNHHHHLDGYLNDLSKKIREQETNLARQITELSRFKTKIEEQKHMNDIDDIWRDVQDTIEKNKGLSKGLKDLSVDLTIKTKELSDFKNKLEHFKHIKDIDMMWDNIQSIDRKVSNLTKKMEEFSFDVSEKITTLVELRDILAGCEHIKDIDEIWNDVEKLQDSASELATRFNEKISQIEKDVSRYEGFLNRQKHFNDVDTMWEGLQENQERIQSCVSNIAEYAEIQRNLNEKLSAVNQFVVKVQRFEHIDDIDETWNYAHNLEKSIEKSSDRISDVEGQICGYEERIQLYENKNSQLKNRLNIAYIIAGSALGVSVIQMILLLTGIL